MKIKNLITLKREEKGISQNRLSKIIGVSQSTINRWEKGEIQSIKNDKIPLLARALGISPSEILDMPMAEQITFQEQEMLADYRQLSTANKNVVTTLIKTLLEGQNK